jgi:hypothetical protein
LQKDLGWPPLVCEVVRRVVVSFCDVSPPIPPWLFPPDETCNAPTPPWRALAAFVFSGPHRFLPLNHFPMNHPQNTRPLDRLAAPTDQPSPHHQPRLRSAWWLCWLLCLLALLAPRPSLAQSYGPPALAWSGALYTYSGNSSSDIYDESSNYLYTLYWDVYSDIYTSHTVTVDNYYVVTASTGATGEYNPYGYHFSLPGMAAVNTNWDGFLGLDPGVTVSTTETSIQFFEGSTGRDPDYSFRRDASTYVHKFLGISDGTVFNLGTSPLYRYHSGGEMVFDPTTLGWPVTTIFPAPPEHLYVNGRTYNFSSLIIDGAAPGYYSDRLFYGTSPIEVDRIYNSGTSTGSIWGFAKYDGYFTATFDPQTSEVTGSSPSDFAISFSGLQGTPSHGPAVISWDGYRLPFLYTDGSGADFYYYDDTDVSFSRVVIAANNAVGVWGFGSDTSGTWNPATSQFDFSGNPALANLFALDGSGNPVGLEAGVTVLGSSSGYGDTLTTASASITPTHFYHRPDGSLAIKYASSAGLAPNSYFFLLGQIFFYGGGELVLNIASGVPVSNAYPPGIYVNGVLWPLLLETIYVGSNSGGASYGLAGPSGPVFSLNWSGPSVSWSWSYSGDGGSWSEQDLTVGSDTISLTPP